jgi:predicted nuclease with TOPRIM domain
MQKLKTMMRILIVNLLIRNCSKNELVQEMNIVKNESSNIKLELEKEKKENSDLWQQLAATTEEIEETQQKLKKIIKLGGVEIIKFRS